MAGTTKRRPPRPRVERTCAHCGRPFLARPSEVEHRGGRYCSRACFREAKGEQPPVARSCEGCGRVFTARASEVEKGGARYCSRVCYDTHDPRRLVDDVPARFWAKVDRSGGPGACWLWTASRTRNTRRQEPYGTFIPHLGEAAVLAHRMAWELRNGPIPDGLWVLHRCDTPLCCNPAHLYLGDHDQNMRDMVARGRSCRGERHAAAKLTWDAVREMRARYIPGVYGYIRLGREYGVSYSVARDIILGRRWKEVGGGDD